MLPDIGDDNANTYLSGTTNLRRFFQMIMEHHFGKFPELYPNVYRKKCWICGSDYLTVKKLAFNITEAVEKFTAVPWSSYLSTKTIKA